MATWKIVKEEQFEESVVPSFWLSKEDDVHLKSGSYMIVVNYTWNQLAINNQILRKARVGISSPTAFNLMRMDHTQGLENYSKAT